MLKVLAAMNSAHPKVIDYATNGMRSDFMDIYLCAKCAFIISTGTGLDAVANIFRRPIAFLNLVPAGCLHTSREQSLGIFKRYIDADSKRELSLSELFKNGVGLLFHSSEYKSNGIDLIENTPEEIRDVAVEMAERLNGTWQAHPKDDAMQQRFWEIFPTDAVSEGKPLHGEIRCRFGASFLRNNQGWLK